MTDEQPEELITVEQKFKLMVSQRPWESEPDTAEWVDESTGYTCRIHRHQTLGHLNGYVTLPRGHKLWGGSYDGFEVDVHGGLTYAAETSTGEFVYGFDCSHAGDFSPRLAMNLLRYKVESQDFDLHHRTEVYREWAWVEKEVLSLAKQLKEME